MRLGYFIALAAFFVVVVGCSKNYYEVGDGLYCLDQDKNSVCDKDEKNPDNLYEFKPGFFCSDVNDNKKCDSEESANVTKPNFNSTVNNSISSLVVSNSTPVKKSDKTAHEECIEKYDVEKGAVIYRYASWWRFVQDDNALYKKGLEDEGYTVFSDQFGTDTANSYDASELMKECFEGVYSTESIIPPEFICSSNKDIFTKDYPPYADVKQFARDCKSAKVV